MKRIVAVLLSAIASLLLFADQVLNLGSMRIRGYVTHVCELTAELDTSLLPFNMTSPDVAPVSDAELYTSPGFGIGDWSVFADYSNLTVTFKASPLTNSSDTINYYIQFSYPQTHEYDSGYTIFPVYSDNDDHVLNLTPLIYDGYVSFTGARFYVRMEDTADSLIYSNHAGGTYSSTVWITVTAND